MGDIKNPQDEKSPDEMPPLSDGAKKLVDLIVRIIVNATFKEIEGQNEEDANQFRS